MTAAELRVVGLVKRLGVHRVLDGVDLHACGGIVAVLGPNGAGKTTLLRCLATVLAPDAGTARLDGLDPAREAQRIEWRRRLGYLPQEVGFRDGARVFDALDHIAVLREVRDDRTRRRLVFDALDRVGLRDHARAAVRTLSGGMRRRLGIAQALLTSPPLLVLDEPAAGLDPDERLRLRHVLAERRRTSTIVLSTHLADEAAFGDVVVVLAAGRIRFAGSPAELAAVALGRTWVQAAPPPPWVRASWPRVDGGHRCLGRPPQGAALVEPTLEDGYLLLTG